MNSKALTRQSDIAAKREHQQSLRRAKKLTKDQRIEFTLEETILIVHAARLALNSRTRAEANDFIRALPRSVIDRFNTAPKERVAELRSYARAS